MVPINRSTGSPQCLRTCCSPICPRSPRHGPLCLAHEVLRIDSCLPVCQQPTTVDAPQKQKPAGGTAGAISYILGHDWMLWGLAFGRRYYSVCMYSAYFWCDSSLRWLLRFSDETSGSAARQTPFFFFSLFFVTTSMMIWYSFSAHVPQTHQKQTFRLNILDPRRRGSTGTHP